MPQHNSIMASKYILTNCASRRGLEKKKKILVSFTYNK